jgi:hypothetical protein
MNMKKLVQNILLIIAGGMLVIWGLDFFLNISPLLTLVVGSTIVVFVLVASYHRGIKLEELEYERLRDKRFSDDPKEYLKYLHRAESKLEDKIIELAEKGKPRNSDIELKLQLVQKEKDRAIKLVEYKKRQK